MSLTQLHFKFKAVLSRNIREQLPAKLRFIDLRMFFVQKETQIRQQNYVLFDVPHSRESRKLGLTKRI